MQKLFSWLILPCCLMLFLGCSDDENDEKTPQSTMARRTVIMYVSAQNSLGYQQFQKSDSIEISNGHYLIEDTDRLLVFMDDDKNPRLYQYTKKSASPKLIRQWKEDINSASPATLEEVLTWTKSKYPAQEYGLVMWSHSDGWIPSTNTNYGNSPKAETYSFGIDVGADGSMKYDEDREGNIGAQMNITDMATAIQRSGIHFKYIFFDSCLMQNLEVGYTLKNVTDFLIGAPMQIPGCGANYTHLLKKGLFTEAEYDIVDTYTNDATIGFDDINNEYYDFGLVISSLRTDKLEKLAQTTADVLSRSFIMNKTNADLNGVLQYQAYTSYYFYRPHNYDAQEAMKKILEPSDFERFSNALNEAIVIKGATKEFWIGPGYNTKQSVDLDHYSGISIFIPQDIYSQNSKSTPFGDLNKAFQTTSWYKAAGWKVTGW